jgi:hypothetical protein
MELGLMTIRDDPASALVTVISVLEPLTDSEKKWVLQSAAARWMLTVQSQAAGEGGDAATSFQLGESGRQTIGQNGDLQSAISKNDPRAFIRLKKPTYDTQRVACLGYFHMKTTGSQGFSSKDIRRLQTDSGGSKINLTRALDNATRQAGYLSNRGPREKQLTTLGEDLVEALPDQEAVAALERDARRPRKGSGKRTSKKRV